MNYQIIQPIDCETIKTLRYFIALRINSNYVRIRKDFSTDALYVIGSIIAENLPTRHARRWKKNISDFSSKIKKEGYLVNSIWPIESSLVSYLTKVIYTEGDIIFFELKLFGEDADHNYFLEVILPAIEDAGYKKDRIWFKDYSLWGNYDLMHIYIADGFDWVSLAEDGEINLKYSPTPWQWINTETQERFKKIANKNYSRIQWINGFGLGLDKDINQDQYRSLYYIINAVFERLNNLLEISNRNSLSIWDFLNFEQTNQLKEALDNSKSIIHGRHDLSVVSGKTPGRWIGSQCFLQQISKIFIPYLNLASILHIGENINYGTGTFILK